MADDSDRPNCWSLPRTQRPTLPQTPHATRRPGPHLDYVKRSLRRWPYGQEFSLWHHQLHASDQVPGRAGAPAISQTRRTAAIVSAFLERVPSAICPWDPICRRPPVDAPPPPPFLFVSSCQLCTPHSPVETSRCRRWVSEVGVVCHLPTSRPRTPLPLQNPLLTVASGEGGRCQERRDGSPAHAHVIPAM